MGAVGRAWKAEQSERQVADRLCELLADSLMPEEAIIPQNKKCTRQFSVFGATTWDKARILPPEPVYGIRVAQRTKHRAPIPGTSKTGSDSNEGNHRVIGLKGIVYPGPVTIGCSNSLDRVSRGGRTCSGV